MKHIKTFLSLILFILFLLFAIQNNTSVNVKFLVFNLYDIPLFIVMIVIFVIGFMLGRVAEWISSLFQNKKENSSYKKNKEK